MKNKQMYVITMESGSYESYNVKIVSVTDDFAKGESYVNKMNQAFLSVEKKLSDFYQNEDKAWQVNNPRPEIKVEKLFGIPKWTGDQKITKEMREERKILQLKNDKITRKAHEPLMQWSKDLCSYREKWAKANFTQEEFEIYLFRDENHWNIEEAKWL